MKRYNLVLADEVFEDVRSVAEQDHVSIVEIVRWCIQLGLRLRRLVHTSGATLIVRTPDGKEKEIWML